MKAMEARFTETVYDAWLASGSMPPCMTRGLLEKYGESSDAFRAFEKRDEEFIREIPPRLISLLERNGKDSIMQQFREKNEKNAIGSIRYSDKAYPEDLIPIDDAPAILFYQGNLQCLREKKLAMVGSRAASYSGMKAARKLAADLSRKGVCIVSGLACGIDTSSHRGCLEGGSPTIAVTASGLDTVYPRDNIGLRDDILKNNGLILSEYAPGEKPAGWHFPFRNRIIAGLGKALILIEARIRSGSMTSVRHTLEQGKDVFVYPGDPSSDRFEGNHQLLREGGIYFTCAEDILEDLHWLDNHTTVGQNIVCCTDMPAVSAEQASVIRALELGRLSFEQLLGKTGISPAEMMSILTVLQISGMIEALPGKQYQLKH